MTTTRTLPPEIKNAKKGKGPNGRNICRNDRCSNEVPKGRRNWCGEDCIHDWGIRNDPGYARWQVFKRDNGVCRDGFPLIPWGGE